MAGVARRLVMLPPGSQTLEELMGFSKRGGMKKAHIHKIGPLKTFGAVHADGRKLAISLQVSSVLDSTIFCCRTASTVHLPLSWH